MEKKLNNKMNRIRKDAMYSLIFAIVAWIVVFAILLLATNQIIAVAYMVGFFFIISIIPTIKALITGK